LIKLEKISYGGEERKLKEDTAWLLGERSVGLYNWEVWEFLASELCWALRMRWLWLKKTDPSRPWADLPIQVPSKARSFFSTMLISVVGNGANTLFWVDKWINGKKVSDIALRLFYTIPERITNRRTVQEALVNRRWIGDIKGTLTVGALIDYLHLWDALSDMMLHPDIEDRHIFSLAPDGLYSAKTTYAGLFQGSSSFHHHRRI
jgi:hypothetical protein